MELCNIEDAMDRVKVICPSFRLKTGAKLSTAALLNMSFDTIKLIKDMIDGRNAYLVPEVPSFFDLKVAVNLDIPILGPTA
jgi:hypothetical protein